MRISDWSSDVCSSDLCGLRAGGGFLMRLTCDDADVETKSDDDSDVVEVYIPTLDDGRLVVWQVEFESDDPRFSGTMAMHWYLSRQGGGTLVTIDAHHVPPGISAKDHVAGLNSSLANLAGRSEEHTSELQSLMRISYAVFCLKKKTYTTAVRRYNKR